MKSSAVHYVRKRRNWSSKHGTDTYLIYSVENFGKLASLGLLYNGTYFDLTCMNIMLLTPLR